MEATAPAIGHNEPPLDADALTERLAEAHGALLSRASELEEAFARVPETVEDEDTAGKAADFIRQLQATLKNAEAARIEEKEPYLDGGRRVDGFFKTRIAERLTRVKGAIEQRLTAYQRRKAEEERARRREEERLAREEAERLAREAREREEALRSEDDLAAAIAAEEAAQRAKADEERRRRQAEASAAEVSRTRTDAGSVASLVTFWDFADLDRETLDLEALREHLPMAALEQGVRSFVKAGGRTLAGVRIFENTKTTVR